MDFTGATVKRVDKTVNFTFGTGAPVSGIAAGTYSVRWTGQVAPRFSETYTFYTNSDDGVRLWVNNKLLVDNYTSHAPTENSATIDLVAGQSYPIQIDYFQNAGGAVAALSWSSASTPKAIVPQAQLFSGVLVSPPPPPVAPSPFNQTPLQISGSAATTLEAENFDFGGEGSAYHDTEAANLGNGAARPNEGVDLETTTDGGNGYDVGYIRQGEWLGYTVNVAQTGAYSFGFRVASAVSGGKLHVEFVDAKNVVSNVTGSVTVPNTGGWTTWQTANVNNVNLTAGQYFMKIVFDAAPSGYVGNLNNVVITPAANVPPPPPPPASPPPPATGPTPYGAIPQISTSGAVTIEAEKYDNGGELVAYHDLEPANLGGAMRVSADGRC